MACSITSKMRSSAFEKIVPFWTAGQSFSSTYYSKDLIIDSVKTLEQEGLPRNEYLVVFSSKEYRALYFSENVYDILGYTNEELVKLKTFAFFNLASLSHIGFVYNMKKSRTAFNNFNKKKEFQPAYIRNNAVGMKLKTRAGVEKTFMIINQSGVGSKLELPETSVCSFIDISHLFESPKYWSYFQSFGGSKTLTQVYFNNSKPQDSLLTPNEEAILKLVYEGFSVKEIPSMLKINEASIEETLKKMVKKVGAKDLTSLIQICRYCKIL